MVDITKIGAFVQKSPYPAWLATGKGDCVYANPALERLTGLNSEEINQADWRSFLQQEDRAAATASWQASLATRTPYRMRVRMQGIDGVTTTVELIAFGYKVDDGTELWLFIGSYVGAATQQGPTLETQSSTDIEDRKRAEEALQLTSNDLQESKARFEEAQRITHVGYWERDLVTSRITWSDEAYRIFGLQPQEHPVDLNTLRQKVHPEDWEFVSRALTDALAGGSRYNVEYRILRPTSELRAVHSEGDVKRDASGRPYQMFGTVQDITGRKRAEEDLQRTQFYLSEGQRLARMGSWAFNPSGFFEYWSPELFKICGLDPQKGAPTLEQYLGTLHPQDRESMAETIETMHAERCGCDVKKRIVRPDGEQRYIRCVGVPVVKGEVLKGFLGTAMDVTEQELLTQELERRQAHLMEAQKLTHTGSWIWRVADRNAIHLSEEWYRIYGFDPAKGGPAWEKRLERVHPEDRPKWKGAIEQAIAEKADYDVEFRILVPNGMVKWIHTVGHPILSDSGDVEQFVGSSTDITERKSAEQEREKLRQLEAELAHINRVSMMGEMAASLAHEIKQPIAAAMTSANSCIEWLAHDPPNLDRARAAAAKIDKYGNRAAEIIDHIRSL